MTTQRNAYYVGLYSSRLTRREGWRYDRERWFLRTGEQACPKYTAAYRLLGAVALTGWLPLSSTSLLYIPGTYVWYDIYRYQLRSIFNANIRPSWSFFPVHENLCFSAVYNMWYVRCSTEETGDPHYFLHHCILRITSFILRMLRLWRTGWKQIENNQNNQQWVPHPPTNYGGQTSFILILHSFLLAYPQDYRVCRSVHSWYSISSKYDTAAATQQSSSSVG